MWINLYLSSLTVIYLVDSNNLNIYGTYILYEISYSS